MRRFPRRVAASQLADTSSGYAERENTVCACVYVCVCVRVCVQYEVSVPVSSMFDCVKGMMDLM